MSQKIVVQRSGGCFYQNMFDFLKQKLAADFPKLVVEDEVVPCVSGCFEIQLVNGDRKTLLHSKLNSGQSITEEKWGAFLSKIKGKV